MKASKQKTDVLRQVRGLASCIAKEIVPQRIILFGSHARGQAGPDSDVDLLVITDHPQGNDASLNLRRKIEYSFPLDLSCAMPAD